MFGNINIMTAILNIVILSDKKITQNKMFRSRDKYIWLYDI